MTIPAVSIVKTDGVQTAIWRVSLTPTSLGNRIGAWVYDHDDPRTHTVVSGTTVLTDQDVDSTIDEISAELQQRVDISQRLFEKYQAEVKQKLTPPAWPSPAVVQHSNQAVSPLVSETLRTANRIGSVLEACRAYLNERSRLIRVARTRVDDLQKQELDPTMSERRKASLAARRASAQAFANGLESGSLALPPMPWDTDT